MMTAVFMLHSPVIVVSASRKEADRNYACSTSKNAWRNFSMAAFEPTDTRR